MFTFTTDTPCHTEAGPDLWFSDHPEDIAEAKRLCATCPLSEFAKCEAGSRDEEFGVWAGKDADERREVERVRKALDRQARDASIIRLSSEGHSVREIARSVGFSVGTVAAVIKSSRPAA
jgi:WhiB family redox-sensing transcriptional regulator